MYSSAYTNQYASGWSWTDADATGNPIVNVPYANNFGNGFVMLTDGNVGIGTTAPATLLHVDTAGADARIRVSAGTNTVQGGMIANTGGLIYAGSITNHGFSLRTNDTDRVRIDTSGNVGIGTTIPNFKFEIGAGSSNVVVAKLTQGYERVRYYGFDLLGYNDGNLWMIGNNATNGLILGSNWDWDAQAGIYYTPGTYGAAGGSLEIGQLTKNNANFTHGNTRFYTNGVERMRIISTGNVGIGTTSPIYNLQVTGLIAVSDPTYNNSGTFIGAILNNDGVTPGLDLRRWDGSANNHGVTYIATNSTGETLFYNGKVASSTKATSLKMIIDVSGNVGIGTSSVTEAIHVYRAANAIIRLQAGGGNVSGVRMDDASSSGYLLKNRSSDVTNNALAGALYTYTDNNKAFQHIHNGTPLFTILSGGNVGIGTTAPGALLNIRASTPTGTGTVTTGTNILLDSNTSNYITFRNTSDNGTYAGLTFLDNNTGGYIVFRNYSGDVATGSDCMIYGSYQDHIFQNSASETINGKTETMRIKANGYVGIGTFNPSAKLHVFQANSGGVAAILLSQDESTIQGPSANTQIRMGSNLVLNASGIIPIGTNGSEKMRIQSDGNVGIGTTSPIYKLHVVGNSYVNAGTLLIDSGNSISWGNSTQYIFGNNGVGLTFVAGSATRMFVSSTWKRWYRHNNSFWTTTCKHNNRRINRCKSRWNKWNTI